MKKIAKILLCLALAALPVLLLAACEDKPTAGMVRLKSEIELRQIAMETCPPCTFVRMERKQYKNICYFTDNKCGFEFTISSYAHKPKIGYIESTYNSWDQSYYDYVWNLTQSPLKANAIR